MIDELQTALALMYPAENLGLRESQLRPPQTFGVLRICSYLPKINSAAASKNRLDKKTFERADGGGTPSAVETIVEHVASSEEA